MVDDKTPGRGDSGSGASSATGGTSPTPDPASSLHDPASSSDTPSRPSSSDSPPTEQQEEEEQLERDIGELQADVERERDEYLELAKRTKADFENYRKRVAGESAQAEKRGRAEIARQLVPVLDNLERALGAAEPVDRESAPSHLAEGVRLVYEELKAVLERNGIEAYEPSGERFDPQWHEAMMTRPASGEQAGTVLEVLEKGYRLDGQVLRPARVVVGSADEEKQPSGGEPPDGFASG